MVFSTDSPSLGVGIAIAEGTSSSLRLVGGGATVSREGDDLAPRRRSHPPMILSADRNLLLGILALQTDFITRDALIAAMLAWSVARYRPLEDILVD
jgi:hypothetical protein